MRHLSGSRFYGLTEAVVSAFIFSEEANSQSVGGDLLEALGERLDDVEARPCFKLLILRAHRVAGYISVLVITLNNLQASLLPPDPSSHSQRTE